MRALALLLIVAAAALGQNPIQWSLTRAVSKKGSVAQLKAKIEPGWHLYGLSQREDGPKATRIWAPEDLPFEVGEVKAPKPMRKHDPNFEMEVEYYSGEVTFELPFKARPGAEALTLKVYFQSCNDKLCLAPRTVTVAESK